MPLRHVLRPHRFRRQLTNTHKSCRPRLAERLGSKMLLTCPRASSDIVFLSVDIATAVSFKHYRSGKGVEYVAPFTHYLWTCSISVTRGLLWARPFQT